MNPADLEYTEHHAALDSDSYPEPLDPSDALGWDDSPNPTPPHVCGQDPDPWCGDCGAAVRAWIRGAA